MVAGNKRGRGPKKGHWYGFALRGLGGVLIQIFVKMGFWMFLVDLNELFQKLFTELKNIDPSPRYRHPKLSVQVILIARANFNRDYLKTQILDL